MNLNFEYNDKYITLRIDYFILKFYSITPNFNNRLFSDVDLLKGISILNTNVNTCKEYYSKLAIVINELNFKKNSKQLLNMSFNSLENIYKVNSGKRTVDFKVKCDIFYHLINDANKINAIGYILELKKVLFAKEIGANIAFNLINVRNSKSSLAMIITINETNINLYNSNKYIYYNPPAKIEEFNLNELRIEFFNGRFSYLKDAKDSIIGLEKSNI